MTASQSTDLTRELAAVPRRPDALFAHPSRVSSHVARSEGYLSIAAAAGPAGVYALYDEMEEKDAHLHSILQTRKNGILARPRRVEAASPSPEDREIAAWLGRTLEQIPGWDHALSHLAGALARGMAIVEVIWGYDPRGRLVPVSLAPRSPWRFSFSPEGELLLDDARALPFGAPTERPGQPGDRSRPMRGIRELAFGLRGRTRQAKTVVEPVHPKPLPERKFIVLLFGAGDERPYGRGLLEHVYWYWWFKKNNLKFWVLYNEKFGAPTVIARHAAGLSQAERDRLMDVIDSLQADAGVTIPEGISLELLESSRRGSAETYRDLANWCNEEMSRAVLGQTLTVSEGQRSGSLALGRVHEAVRFDYVRADAAMLSDAVNNQLVRWIMELNFPNVADQPRWVIDLAPEPDPKAEIEIDRQLLQMGVPLPLRYFFERYRRPEPGAGDHPLRYDDHNLFQYHLQFGVLTVNEVRASLGLPAVPWGDRPTSSASAQDHIPSAPPAVGDGPLNEQEAEGETNESQRDRRAK